MQGEISYKQDAPYLVDDVELHGGLYVIHGVDAELAVPGGLHNILAQHQVLYIRRGNDDTLFTGQTSGFTDIEEAFYFLAYAAYSLYLAVLVDSTRDRQRLLQRDTAQC